MFDKLNLKPATLLEINVALLIEQNEHTDLYETRFLHQVKFEEKNYESTEELIDNLTLNMEIVLDRVIRQLLQHRSKIPEVLLEFQKNGQPEFILQLKRALYGNFKLKDRLVLESCTDGLSFYRFTFLTDNYRQIPPDAVIGMVKVLTK